MSNNPPVAARPGLQAQIEKLLDEYFEQNDSHNVSSEEIARRVVALLTPPAQRGEARVPDSVLKAIGKYGHACRTAREDVSTTYAWEQLLDVLRPLFASPPCEELTQLRQQLADALNTIAAIRRRIDGPPRDRAVDSLVSASGAGHGEDSETDQTDTDPASVNAAAHETDARTAEQAATCGD